MGGVRRRLVVLSIVVTAWCTVTLTGIGAAAWVALLGDLGCEAGDSNYGDLEWSVVPPSPRCVWTDEENGFTAEDDPSLAWSVWLLAVATLAALTWWQIRATMTEARRLSDPNPPDPAEPSDPVGAPTTGG